MNNAVSLTPRVKNVLCSRYGGDCFPGCAEQTKAQETTGGVCPYRVYEYEVTEIRTTNHT